MAVTPEKVELLNSILDRNLSWIDAADTKGNLVFVITTAMLGVIAALVPFKKPWTIQAEVCSIITVLFLLSGLIFIILAAFPRMKKYKSSLVFFGGIAAHEEKEYVQKIIDISPDDLAADIAQQCHRTAEIVKVKYTCVKKAIICMFIALPFWAFSLKFLYAIKCAASK
jgi:hypothetical protein